MARTKGKGERKTGKFNQRKMLYHGDKKYPALQPKKTQEFKQLQMHHLGSDLKSGNPCLDIMLAAGEASLPPCLYKTPLSSGTVSIRKTKNKTSSHYLNRRKLAALSNHFNPIPFVREKPSHFATHRLLLSRLGLWNFLHLDFGQNIHSDLIKQLIVYYNPKKPAGRRSYVNGCPVLVSRAMLARALSLPLKRLNLDAASIEPLVVSEEEAVFLEELVSSWLVLHDGGCELPAEVLKVKFLITETRLEEVDWAELIWFMVRSELLKGAKLVNCHYASHMQLLLMNQKPRLFVNHVEIVEGWEKRRNLGVGLGNNVVTVKESNSGRKTESTQERCSKWRNSSPEQCEEGSTCYHQSSLQKEDGNGKLKLLGGGDDGDGEDDEIKRTVTEELIVGHSGELPDILKKKLTVDLECNEKNEWQERLKMESGNKELKLLPDEGDKRKVSNELAIAELHAKEVKGENTQLLLLHHDEDASELLSEGGSGMEEMFYRKTCDFIGSQEKEVNNDSEGKQMDYNQQQLESVSANNMLMNGESREDRLKVEGSSNLPMSEIPHHGMQETNFHQMDLVAFSDDKCEAKYGLNVSAEYQNAIEGETSTSHHRHAIETEDENMKMIKCEASEYKNMIDGETFTSGYQHAINRKVLQNELPEGSRENEQINGKAGEFLESQEKKMGKKLVSFLFNACPFCATVLLGDYNIKEDETEMMRNGDYEKELFHDNQEVEICFTAEMLKPEQLRTAKPEANGSNEISLKSFAVEEIDCWNVTNSAATAHGSDDDEDEESYDLDLCSNQVQLWMSRLKSAVENQMDKSF